MSPSTKKLSAATIALCAAMFCALPAWSTSIQRPEITLVFGSQEFAAAENLLPAVDSGTIWRYSDSIQTPEYAIDVQAEIDTDPYLTYGFSVMNFTDKPLTVSKRYSIPVTGGPWNTVLASLSIAAVGGSKGFFIDAPDGGAIQAAWGDQTDLGIGLGVDCSSAQFGAVTCYGAATSSSIPYASFQTLWIAVDFTLAGKGAGATVSGRVELADMRQAMQQDVQDIPEPRWLALPALALAAIRLRRGRP